MAGQKGKQRDREGCPARWSGILEFEKEEKDGQKGQKEEFGEFELIVAFDEEEDGREKDGKNRQKVEQFGFHLRREQKWFPFSKKRKNFIIKSHEKKFSKGTRRKKSGEVGEKAFFFLTVYEANLYFLNNSQQNTWNSTQSTAGALAVPSRRNTQSPFFLLKKTRPEKT